MTTTLSQTQMQSNGVAGLSDGFADGQNDQVGRRSSKLQGRAFYQNLGSPKWIVAPMVDQSEFAWRLLTRSFLAPSQKASVLAYSPMLHSRLFASNPNYRLTSFQPIRSPIPSPPNPITSKQLVETEAFLDGNPANDRPLIVQFCANDPELLLQAAQHVAPFCDAVDLNLGCPQGIAKRGHYGAFLQEDWPLIHRLIKNLHDNLDIPVTAKFRIQETKERTLEYAKMILSAGANFITVHGRRREQKGHNTGVADWSYIRYLRENLPPDTVIFANGNILNHADLVECLEATGADAVMSAEGNLHDPGIFADPPENGQEGTDYWRSRDGKGGWRIDAVMRRYFDIIYQYVLGRSPPQRSQLLTLEEVAANFPQGDCSNGANGINHTNGHIADSAPAAVSNGSTTMPEANEANKDPTPANEEDQEEGEEESSHPSKKQKLSKKQRKRAAREAAKAAARDPSAPRPAKPVLEKPHDPNMTAMQAHLFSLLRIFVSTPGHEPIRDQLARCKSGDMAAYERVLDAVEARIREGMAEYARDSTAFETAAGSAVDEEMVVGEESSAAAVARCARPWWVCQPFVRPLPSEAMAKGAMQLSKKDKLKIEEGVHSRKRAREEDDEEMKRKGLPVDGSVESISVDGKAKEQVEVAKDGLVCG